ncbi:MAG: methyltransferase domain-containing protein [Paracoccaceae bacterium]|jgi:predicted TPR repeat methyltransferase|nr:methyltransferase domain-containing protein [Paracoccaceae bacterium]
MTDKAPLRPILWTERTTEETIQVYTDWADTYDSDLATRGYRTPMRIAQALQPYKDELTGPILDFGCGTGLSGIVLAEAGYRNLHGTDITAEMLKIAETKNVYDKIWQSSVGDISVSPGDYNLIVAAGVISLGAAQPEILSDVLDVLDIGGLLAFSFNDPTLENKSYDAALDAEVSAGRAKVLFREHGPHLDDPAMGSDVIILRRT